jgi:hypothetical protein
MIPTCSWCGAWIASGNARWPGYCRPTCRTAAHDARLEWLADKARERRSRRLGALGPRSRTT